MAGQQGMAKKYPSSMAALQWRSVTIVARTHGSMVSKTSYQMTFLGSFNTHLGSLQACLQEPDTVEPLYNGYHGNRRK